MYFVVILSELHSALLLYAFDRSKGYVGIGMRYGDRARQGRMAELAVGGGFRRLLNPASLFQLLDDFATTQLYLLDPGPRVL